MMKKCFFIMFVPFIFLIGGCSGGEGETPEKSKKAPLFNDQRQALEKAKGVEKLLQKSMDKRNLNAD